MITKTRLTVTYSSYKAFFENLIFVDENGVKYFTEKIDYNENTKLCIIEIPFHTSKSYYVHFIPDEVIFED